MRHTGAVEEIELAGGVANAGSVTRVGPHVLRPSNPHTDSVFRLLTAVHDDGFDGASVPVGIDDDGRERLIFIPGDVPVPPFPKWSQSDDALASVASLIRDFHHASRRFVGEGLSWSDEMADPVGGSTMCHNDVCLENVVFRDGVAAALLDFDFAAPGRPVYDLARFARMCVPIDDDLDAARLGFEAADRPARLRLIADTYGLVSDERRALLEIMDETIARGGEFVRRRVEAGDLNFITMWDETGGMARYDRRRVWWSEHRGRYAQALS
jgi:hypothetical protein